MVFDGLNINVEHRGSADVLALLHRRVHQVFPGIDMQWSYKEIDDGILHKKTRCGVRAALSPPW